MRNSEFEAVSIWFDPCDSLLREGAIVLLPEDRGGSSCTKGSTTSEMEQGDASPWWKTTDVILPYFLRMDSPVSHHDR